MEKIINYNICEGVDFSHIKTQKFKNAGIAITFFVPLDKNLVSGFSVLISVLSDSCEKFKNFQSLNEYIEEIYGANLDYDISKIGNYQMLELYISALDDKFTANHEKNTEKIADLLCELVFNPLINDNKFDENIVLKRKNEIIELIDNQIANKRTWSMIRCNQIMFENEKCGIRKYGTKEDVQKINEKNLFEFYTKLIQNSRIKISFLTDCNCQNIVNKFKEYFSKINRNPGFNFEKVSIKMSEKVKEIKEKMNVEQCKLVMGFRTPFIKPNAHNMSLASAILGGLPTSKLFMNVREKMNLCYYCASMLDAGTGALYISSGVEESNCEKAKNEILNQIKLMQNGEITDDELNEAKNFLMQHLKSISDKISTLYEWYLGQYPFSLEESPEEYSEKIAGASKKDIVDCISKISLDTVYVLTGGK